MCRTFEDEKQRKEVVCVCLGAGGGGGVTVLRHIMSWQSRQRKVDGWDPMSVCVCVCVTQKNSHARRQS